MRFYVLVNRKPKPVDFVLAGQEDVAAIGRWRSPRSVRNLEAVQDTLEYAHRAAERWRYYKQTLPVATTEAQVRRSVAANKVQEISMFFVVRAPWFKPSPLIAFAQCRRTFCHNLVLEFLGTHPRLAGHVGPKISGIGSGALCGLTEFAHTLGMRAVWGEATAISAGFYSTVLETRIKDHFYIQGPLMSKCRRKFREEMMGTA